MNNARYQLKFLESIENLKSILSTNSGRTVSQKLCNNIMCCLEQGRSFFGIAELSPLEIKPLIVFYGMMGFARAIIMVRKLNGIETLPQKHGLSDISTNVSNLESLTLRVANEGTFHLMNDMVRNLEKLIVDRGSDIICESKPTAESQALCEKTFTLKDILARIPGIQKHYMETFNENGKVIKCSHFIRTDTDSDQFFHFTIFVDGSFKSKEDLVQIVSELRNTFPFLKNWSFRYAGCSRDFTYIDFTNQIYQDYAPENNSDVIAGVMSKNSCKCETNFTGSSFIDNSILSKTDPISGSVSLDMNPHIIESFEGIFLSELALFYMGMFLLSSLVRYRPDIWSNTLSRRAISTNPVDDKPLSLIENFIEISLLRFPQFIVHIIKAPFL